MPLAVAVAPVKAARSWAEPPRAMVVLERVVPIDGVALAMITSSSPQREVATKLLPSPL